MAGLILSSSDWNLINDITNVLKFFHEATLDLSSDNTCISIIIPLISLLNRKLLSRDDDENEEVANMKKQLHDCLNKRFAYIKGHPSLIISTLLDPRFKSKYLTSDEVDIGIKEILNFLNVQQSESEVNRVENIHVSSSEQSNIEQPKEEGLWDTHDNSPDRTDAVDDLEEQGSAVLKRNIHCYLTEPRLRRNANIYLYWNSNPYPCLRKVVLKYLSAPPTSVPSEQLFSAAGKIYADRRSNLLGENAQKLLFLTYNIRLFNYNY